MARTSGLKLGTKAPASGQYQQIGPRRVNGREVTAVKGNRYHRRPCVARPTPWLTPRRTNPEAAEFTWDRPGATRRFAQALEGWRGGPRRQAVLSGGTFLPIFR